MAIDKKRKVESKNKASKNEQQKTLNKKIVFEENLEEPATDLNHEKFRKNKIEENEIENMEKKWFELYDGYNSTAEMVDLKETEINELRKICRQCFDLEYRRQLKKNPSDAKWLETALEKGTSKDRANAGALLVQTNPICNLAALESLLTLTKPTNKGHLDAMEIITELLINSIMPTFRKLISIPLRGADWKNIKKLDLEKTLRDKIFAYWHFEDALRDLYFQFLTNLSTIVQTGKDNSKAKVIVHTSKLFMLIPEKEAYLLSLLVNKLGDPSKQIASKAHHHLLEVVRKHPAMSSIIVVETEKLLFRNNISQSAQHYALSYLSGITRFGDYESSQRMINICFAFFKIHTEKGEINSKTMQSILTCLRKAIGNVKRDTDIAEIVKPETLNTVFRLIHLADISIAFQSLSLLLEITEAAGESQDRFYNTLYKKLLDPQLASAGPRISQIFFYILHRAIQNDPKNERAQSFIKRLLQVAFYFPPAKVCGILIVINKVLRKRKFLNMDGQKEIQSTIKVDSSEDEEEEVKMEVKTENKKITKYDPFLRSSEFAGAKFSMKYELLRYLDYFHPTVRNFAECIIQNKPLTYYGDPLRDFSLGQFLDRFSFKNPKKPKHKEGEDEKPKHIPGVPMKKNEYVPAGSRGRSVHALTEENCTEDERFIFEFLQQKREKLKKIKAMKDGDSDTESIGDDEFEKYLDSLGVPGRNKNSVADVDHEDFDFLTELEEDMAKSKKNEKNKKKKKKDESDDEEEFDDWDEGSADEEDDELLGAEEDFDSDGGSISLDEDEDLSGGELDEDEPAPKKSKKSREISDKVFQKKLKSSNMNSLFSAADDFSEMLENNGQDKSHGTLGEIFNKDKSSDKQLAWERTRLTNKGAQRGKKKFISKKQGSSSIKKSFQNAGKSMKKGKQFRGKKK